MGYHVISSADVEATSGRPASQYALGAAAGLEQFALNEYEADPGEAIPLAYHYHTEQEEALYVLEGTVHVETPEETFELGEGQVFVAEPESPHRAFNPADAAGPVRVLAVGAPAVDDAEVYEP